MPHRTGNTTDGTTTDTPNHQVVDFNEIRAQKLEEKRRTTERIFFKHLLSVYSVVAHDRMFAIELIDVSEEGCAFQIPFDATQPWPADTREIPLRLYFSQDTYLEIHVTIQNSRPAIEKQARYLRFGCSVDQSTGSYEAYRQFVNFMKLYAQNAHRDRGDVSVFYL